MILLAILSYSVMILLEYGSTIILIEKLTKIALCKIQHEFDKKMQS